MYRTAKDTQFQAHVRRCDYYPEHYAMPLAPRMHLTCRLLGQIMAWGRQVHQDWDVAQCRAVLENGAWPEWDRWAVKEHLPPASATRPSLRGVRVSFGPFPAEELDRLLDEEDVWLDELESVRCQVHETLKRKLGTLKAWREVATLHDPRFESIRERILDHDADLFRYDRLRGFTLGTMRFLEPGEGSRKDPLRPRGGPRDEKPGKGPEGKGSEGPEKPEGKCPEKPEGESGEGSEGKCPEGPEGKCPEVPEKPEGKGPELPEGEVPGKVPDEREGKMPKVPEGKGPEVPGKMPDDRERETPGTGFRDTRTFYETHDPLITL